MAEAAIAAEQLVRRYGEIEAVRGIELAVEPGEIFGFLGPNGAGKSTTISMLCTLLRPTSGRARVAGFDVVHDPDSVRAQIGLVFQDPSLDEQLTTRENLEFHAFLYDVPRATRRQRINEVLEMVELADRAASKVLTFSGGMKRRLEIARGILGPIPRRADAWTRSPDAPPHLGLPAGTAPPRRHHDLHDHPLHG